MKLFGEEDIQQELFLSMCEWPTDDTRVLIHGYWYALSWLNNITCLSGTSPDIMSSGCDVVKLTICSLH